MDQPVSSAAYASVLGGPSALLNLEPRQKPWFLIMTAKTSSSSRKKKKKLVAEQPLPTAEEIRTSIEKTQYPVEYLRMLNDVDGAHAEYTRLTVCDSSTNFTHKMNIASGSREAPLLEEMLHTGNTRELLMKQLLEASGSILDAYDSSSAILPPALLVTADAHEDAGVKSRTRRRGRKAFRFEYATIMCGTMSEETAAALCEKWNTRSRTVKSRAAIAVAMSDFYGLDIGINEKLISGPVRFWDVTLRDGVIHISKNNTVHHRVPLLVH